MDDNGIKPPAKLFRPLLIDTERLKPLPSDMYNIACARCDQPRSKWAFLPVEAGPDGDPLAMCSACFLYHSNWGINRKEDIAEFTKMVEEEMGVTFARAEDGTLVETRDCDRLLGTIALTSRAFLMRIGPPAEPNGPLIKRIN